VLLEQPFVKDDKVTIGDLVKALSENGRESGSQEIRRLN